jgi:signal transduction histidine kinase
VLEPRVLDLNSVLAGMENMLRRLLGESIELSIRTFCELEKIEADPGQLEQVVMNLAVNA